MDILLCSGDWKWRWVDDVTWQEKYLLAVFCWQNRKDCIELSRKLKNSQHPSCSKVDDTSVIRLVQVPTRSLAIPKATSKLLSPRNALSTLLSFSSVQSSIDFSKFLNFTRPRNFSSTFLAPFLHLCLSKSTAQVIAPRPSIHSKFQPETDIKTYQLQLSTL